MYWENQHQHPSRQVRSLPCRLPLPLLLLLFAVLCLTRVQMASAAIEGQSIASLGKDSLQIPIYKSTFLQLHQPAKRISVGNPGIADIVILHSRQIHLVGKALGTTNVVLWDAKNSIFATFEVEITHDLETLKLKLHELLPEEDIKVTSAQERIILSGEVSNVVKMTAAKELAFSFLPECIASESNVVIRDTTQGPPPVVVQQGGGGRPGGSQECKEGSVVNLMQVGGAQQVMLQVKVAEIARTVLKRLDGNVNLMSFGNPIGGLVNGGASFPNALNSQGLLTPLFGSLGDGSSPIGPPVALLQPSTPGIENTGAFLSYLSGDLFFKAVLDISRKKGLAKILAEPTLTTLTGQQAQFLSGGEFPVPVPGNNGDVTVKFKEFGVGVKFVPVVLDSGRISLKLNINVSEISQNNSVSVGVFGTESTFVIPSLTKRSVGSTVELADGQTIGIAGLISDNLRQFVDKLPGMGDIPILGALFRSQEYLSGQTELVIFVTPHLARPISPQRVMLPTDSFVPASDLQFYLMGQMEGTRKPDAKRHGEPLSSSGGTETSQFGHQL